MRNLKILLIALVTFSCGMAAQAKITTPTPQIAAPQVSSVNPTPYNMILAGKASWYSKQSPGINKHTANNEVFNDRDLTCAMWGAPFNQTVKVTNRKNGKSVIVRVNDRGPHFRYFRKGRVIDLTKAAFARIAPLDNGLIDVEVTFLNNDNPTMLAKR
jgi:rare lipoprotein A